MFSRIFVIFSCIIVYTYAAYAATTLKPSSTNNKKCGVLKPEGYLKKNITSTSSNNPPVNYAGLGEYPWTVAIYKENIVTCAGSLITQNIVLTAGHCIKDLQKENIKVKAGLWDLTNQTEQYPVQERIVSQIIIHPDYSNENKTIKNDIALLALEKPVELSEHINLVCLAKKDHEEKSSKCYAAGWGKENKDGKSPMVLKKMHLPFVKKDDCEKKLKEKMPSLVLNEKTICAGGDKASTCIGDGGAALVCQIEPESENRYVQSGITSWGIGCMNELPGIYTNVPKFRDWIDEQVKKLGGETKYYTV